MAQREERDETDTSEESVEVPVNVVDDSEAEGAGGEDSEPVEASEDLEESSRGGEADADADADADIDGEAEGEAGDGAEADGDDEEDIFLPPEESDVEVLDADDGSLEGPIAQDDNTEQLNARIEELEQKVEELEEERDDFKDRMMRVAADFENFKKRSKRNEEELRKYGVKGLASDLLSAIDNLERALEHADSSDEESIIDGVDMVVSQLHTTLEKHGVEVFDATGEAFNPEHHEAIQQVETPDHDSGEVLEQFQRGYFLHDRLLRPALVSVAKKVGGEAEPGDEQDERDGEGDAEPTETSDEE